MSTIYSVDLPIRYHYNKDISVEANLVLVQNYITQLNNSMEKNLKELFNRVSDVADSPTADNIATVDVDGNVIDGGKVFDTDGTLSGNSDLSISTEKAVKTYVDNAIGSIVSYDIGTWTPDLQFGGAKVGITYSVQQGYFTKIGRLVVVSAEITLSSKGSSSGAATIHGLPYTVFNGDNNSSISLKPEGITFGEMMVGYVGNNTNNIILQDFGAGGGASVNMDDTNFANNSSLYLSCSYITAT